MHYHVAGLLRARGRLPWKPAAPLLNSVHKVIRNNSKTTGQSPFKVLDLPHTASETQIKTRYRELAKSLHPDASGDAVKFLEVGDAYQKLSNPQSRSMWAELERKGQEQAAASEAGQKNGEQTQQRSRSGSAEQNSRTEKEKATTRKAKQMNGQMKVPEWITERTVTREPRRKILKRMPSYNSSELPGYRNPYHIMQETHIFKGLLMCVYLFVHYRALGQPFRFATSDGVYFNPFTRILKAIPFRIYFLLFKRRR